MSTKSASKNTDAKSSEPKVRKAKQISMIEHVKKRSMWAGSKSMQTIESYVLGKDDDGSRIFKLADLKYPPVLLKIIDEIIVNALDHETHYPKLVTKIDISVVDGMITVYNDGPGIPVEQTKNINGVSMYSPQLIFSEFLAGSNFDDDDVGEGRVVGGQNGIGAKLTVVYSKLFTVETVDKTSNTYYKQSFSNGLATIEPPIVKKSKEAPYTKISFVPEYSEFKLSADKFGPTLNTLMETRAWQAAAYSNAKISYNGELIPIKSFEDFCQMFSENIVYTTKMKRPDGKHTWDIGVAVSDGKERHISIVNGVHIPKGGSHIQYIQNQIVANLKHNIENHPQIKKSGINFNKNYILNNVFVFMRGAIPSPEFLSQTKEAISDPVEKFASYSITAADWSKIWNLLESAIMSTFLKKQLGGAKTRANRGKVDVPKYVEAKYCRDAKKCLDCGLIITEGDSATGTADTGLLSKASPNFNYDYFGTFGIQGVMVNGLKESIELKASGKKKKALDDSAVKVLPKKRGDKSAVVVKTKDDLDMPVKRIPNKKLISNERIDSLRKVLGLDFNKTYAVNTEIGDKEWKTLRYGYIIGLTDQDLDGFNIFGLLATFIMTYWPSLLQRGFLRRINTPVIRAYPKNKKKFIEEFYSMKDFRNWTDKITEEKAKAMYNIKYYKGLGSHNPRFKEITQMFKNIDTKICTYELDNIALNTMYVYYGPDTAPRKVALATPVSRESIDSLTIPISQHFEIDAKMYQRDNIIRKLLNAIDGFVVSRRKVFYCARLNGRKEIKVQGLAGMAVAEANYHHGETSLEQTIVRMAQGFPMARNLPLLQPDGGFGTRKKGYKDNAASRYIYTVLNWRLADKLFRKEDDFILEYELDGGERYEPKYYCPIIPYVLCETNILPATGWAISVQARDIKAIFKNVRDMIEGKISKCKKLPMWNKDFKGTVRKYKNRNYHVGVYSYDETDNIVYITELPPGICSNTYLKGSDDDKIKKKNKEIKDKKDKKESKGIQTKEWVEDFEDLTTMDGVNITLYLKKGAYDAITAADSGYGNDVFDCFEEYFELKDPIYDRINLINDKGEVIEYSNYEDVFDDWYNFRKDLYLVRVKREKILISLELKMYRNIQRFNREHDKYNITNKTAEDALISILHKNKYNMFNHTILENPKYTNVDELKHSIENDRASYEYLLRITYRDLTENAYNKREKIIEKLEARLEYLEDETGSFPGAKLWLHELEELEVAIKDGLASEWSYGENEVVFRN